MSKNYYTKTIVRPVNFVNVERLWTQFKIAPPSKKIIPVVESFGTKEGYVGLAKLTDYYKFLHQTDEDEAFNPIENKDPILDEQLFDSNVRGYQIKSGVNGRIARTLKKGTDEFWLLNNGITIICSDVIHSNEAFDIHDPQIVNGLQTSRRIFEYYKGLKDIPENDERRILIRAIKSHGETKRSDIIRATNDQNSMPAEAFLSTLRIQHQIEATFETNGLFYDRRKGYYRDLRKPATEIVEVVFLTQAIVSILLRKPHDGRGRPKDYFKENKREQIWGSDGSDQTNKKEPFDLDVYLRCVQILRKVDNYLAGLDITDTKAKDLRCYIALDVAAHAVSNAYCPPNLIAELDVERDITKDLLDSAYKRVYRIYKKRGEDDNAAKNKGMTEDLTKLLKKELSPKKKKGK